MTGLAWANIKHRKLRSALAALAVAIGIAMLVTMLAMSHGMLEEVASRVEGIRADLIVLPSQTSLIFSEGAPLSEKFIEKIKNATVGGRRIVQDVIPVYLSIMPEMAKQQQRVFCIDRTQFEAFSRKKPLREGCLFDSNDGFKNYLTDLKKSLGSHFNPEAVAEDRLNRACELVIDERLAKAGKYRIGQKVPFLGRSFTICGICQSGAAGRVFAPVQVIRQIELGGMERSSIFFVKLDPATVTLDESDSGGKATLEACKKAITETTHLKTVSLSDYGQLLFDSFKSIYVYINVASLLVLIVSFLFIMVTIYTLVLERRREIGILRSMGATGLYIMGQTVAEALIISVCGMAGGLLLSVGAKAAIEGFRPLLTVDLQPHWLILGVAVGLVGGLVSAIYPGFCALRQDPLAALGYE